MRPGIRVACGALGGLVSVAAHAAGDVTSPLRLRGEVYIAGVSLVDPPSEETRDTHAYFRVTGAAARHLFDTIPGAPHPDLCLPHRRFKQAGHMTCSTGADGRDAICEFAIDLRTGALGAGSVC